MAQALTSSYHTFARWGEAVKNNIVSMHDQEKGTRDFFFFIFRMAGISNMVFRVSKHPFSRNNVLFQESCQIFGKFLHKFSLKVIKDNTFFFKAG